jgi:hypothetical protein
MSSSPLQFDSELEALAAQYWDEWRARGVLDEDSLMQHAMGIVGEAQRREEVCPLSPRSRK